jgi:RTX calcium-binding nonapeptide repeat (4 copies)
MKRRSLIAAIVFVFVGQASTAFASTAFVGPSERFPDHGAVHYVADPGETNKAKIDLGHITDAGATITAGPGCTSLAPNEVSCQVADDFFSIEVALGDGDDFLSVNDENQAVLKGGLGDDRIDGGDNLFGAREYLFGGPGDDVLRGRRGDDVLDGGAGADLMSGGTSCDAETAGQCFINDDTVTYDHRTARVRADADIEAADDGERGEGDTIMADVEVIVGGKGNDVLGGITTNLTCCDGPHRLIGMILKGRAGDDILRGTRGLDLSIEGGPGNDMLRGDEGSDRLSGGAGGDTLVGDRGPDLLRAGKGDDSLLARDGQQDHVNGGPGSDEARIDAAIDHIRKVEKLL